ncbi:MAG: YaaR family protein [Clostridiaceae bacterium]|nr:YaaR family protein [Clostridiaceae bacterium]
MRVSTINTTGEALMRQRVTEKAEDEFGQKLAEKREAVDIKQKLKNLLERIDVQAERLSNNMNIAELKEYKRLVQEFLHIVTKNSYRFEKQQFLDSRGRYRVFSIVKKVNEHLDSLTKEILRKEKSRIDILSRLDDIRGLLLNVVV